MKRNVKRKLNDKKTKNKTKEMQKNSVNSWQGKLKYEQILENIYKKDGIVRPE